MEFSGGSLARYIRQKVGEGNPEYATQEGLAKALGCSQQTVSRAERRPVIPLTPKYKERVVARFPEARSWIEEYYKQERAVEPSVPRLSPGHYATPPLIADEHDALPWVVTHRTAILRQMVAERAWANGLDVQPLSNGPFGLLVTKGPRKDQGMMPRGDCEFSLTAGTVLMIGSPHRRPDAGAFLNHILRKAGADVRFVIDEDRFEYFGVDANIVMLARSDATYHPRRELEPKDFSLVYTDWGVLATASTGLFKDNPFGPKAKRLIIASGCHRLATGYAVEMAITGSLLRRVANGFDLGSACSALLFQVKARGPATPDGFTRLEVLKEELRWP